MRRILAVVLGVVVGNAVFFLVSLVAGQLYPPDPELIDPQTPEATAQRVDDADTNGLLLILLGGALGGLAAGVTSAGIERERPLLVATGVAGLLAVWAATPSTSSTRRDSGSPSGCSSSCPSFAILGLL